MPQLDTYVTTVFNHFFSGTDGYTAAYASPQRLKSPDRPLTYGEILLDSFFEMFRDIPLTAQHKVFYDLGSGIGKAVLAAVLLGNFEKVCGVEILTDLHKIATGVLSDFIDESPTLFPSRKETKVILHNGDFFSYNVSDADVVFIQSTCFGEELMAKLSEKLSSLKPGSIIITATYDLPGFSVYASKKYTMSWGNATFYFHVR
ncbi:MAG: hypothetical protein WCW16_03670 [Candidatus Magasanikbacteria bacterium]